MSRRAFTVVQSSLVIAIAVLVASVVVTAGQQRADALRWPSERPPRPLAAKPVKFPPYEIRTLPNGLQVVLVSQNEQPVVIRPHAHPRRRGPGSEGEGRAGDADVGPARPGHHDALGGPDRRGDRLHGRAGRQLAPAPI